jgi:hypothetical protein
VPDDDVVMVQTDGPDRCVYIKFVSNDKMTIHLQRILGRHEYKHPTGEITHIEVRQTGLDCRSVQVTGLPLEVPYSAIVAVMTRYGDIQSITGEMWTSEYRYKVSTGARYVNINLKTHIPSQLTISGYKSLVTYDGQKATCFTCYRLALFGAPLSHNAQVVAPRALLVRGLT